METSRKTMSKTSSVFVLGLFSLVMLSAVAFMPYSMAESQVTHTAEETPAAETTSVVPLGDGVSLEKTIMTISIPQDNTLPWAFVDGMIENPAEDYPVIIQFFNEESGEEPMHVAQVDVEEDGSYEYKFRVRDVNLETGDATNIFEGDYLVKVFKVINTESNLDSV